MNNTNNNSYNDKDDDYDYDYDVDFADHDLDDLPADALQHLEANALRATQHAPARSAPPDSDYGGFDDGEEVVNLDDEHNPTTANNNNDNGNHNYHNTVTSNHTAPTTTTILAPTASQADAGQLLVRIKKLEQEQARNKKQAHDLRVQLQTKAGEADTLRRRHDAEARRYERQLADQQLYHADQLAQLRLDMEKLRREKDQAHTANLFDQHDAREAGMAHRTRSAAMPSRPKSTTAAALSPATTPKRAQRSRTLLGDGFDDQDVIMASPSRSRDRLKMATPRQLAKRKRQTVDQSPIPLPALQLSEPRNKLAETSTENPPPAAVDSNLLHLAQHDDGRFFLLHRLLAQPSMTGTDRILEALTQYAFPSQPMKKISSLLYDALSDIPPADAHSLALRICDVFLSLWKRCLDERYYAPVFLILNAVNFVLTCEPAKTAIETAERIVPLIIASVDLVALPIANAAKLGGEAVNSLYSTNQRTIASQINVVDCLQLLYLIATSCTSFTDQTDPTRLWKMIPSSFAIMLLNKEFPQAQIMLMLKILGTSALASTIGPIAIEEESQANVEDALINRLTNIFNETPRSMPGPAETIAPISETTLESDILDLRLLVLMVLTKFSVSQHGSSRLAENRICIGRLIKYLDVSITSLYLQPLSSTQAQKVESINATMKLIFHITTSNPGFDIKTKLANTLGGQHAYLVALTRLAFSEGLALEAGIEDAVVDMAHSILDEGLSPQEGDAFGMVFSSGNSI